MEKQMDPVAYEIWREAVQHCIAVSREAVTPGELYEVYGPDDDVQYTYQMPNGKRFSCLGSSLVACRLARDWWIERGCPRQYCQPFAN
jgi:hypothetical protein